MATTDLVVVAQSMGAFTAALVAARVPVDLLILVAAMVPAPGETPGEWWENTGQVQAMRAQAIRDGRDPDQDFDPVEILLNEVAPEVVAEAGGRERHQSGTPFEKPWPLDA